MKLVWCLIKSTLFGISTYLILWWTVEVSISIKAFASWTFNESHVTFRRQVSSSRRVNFDRKGTVPHCLQPTPIYVVLFYKMGCRCYKKLFKISRSLQNGMHLISSFIRLNFLLYYFRVTRWLTVMKWPSIASNVCKNLRGVRRNQTFVTRILEKEGTESQAEMEEHFIKQSRNSSWCIYIVT